MHGCRSYEHLTFHRAWISSKFLPRTTFVTWLKCKMERMKEWRWIHPLWGNEAPTWKVQVSIRDHCSRISVDVLTDQVSIPSFWNLITCAQHGFRDSGIQGFRWISLVVIWAHSFRMTVTWTVAKEWMNWTTCHKSLHRSDFVCTDLTSSISLGDTTLFMTLKECSQIGLHSLKLQQSRAGQGGAFQGIGLRCCRWNSWNFFGCTIDETVIRSIGEFHFPFAPSLFGILACQIFCTFVTKIKPY